VAAGALILGALVRGAGAELGEVTGAAGGTDGRGATMGRAAGTALGALPGIIGRGGKSIGRPAAAWPAGAGAGAGDVTVFAAGAASTTGPRTAGTASGIALGIGVGPFGTLDGAEVSSMAAANAAFARCVTAASASSLDRFECEVTEEFEENSSSIEDPAEIVMTPPQTEQRARTMADGTFAGSTRKTERHSGQETFTCPPSRPVCRAARQRAGSRSASHPAVGRWRTLSREASSRSSSFQLRVRSLAPRA